MADDERPETTGPDEEGPPSTPDSGPLMIGPILGVIIGYVTFRLLPDDTPILLGFLIVLIVIALVIYATIEIGRRRSRRS
jgi:hypothetical protein